MELQVKQLCALDTKLFADTVEWCPYDGMQDVLLCGTYQLSESSSLDAQKQVRIGQLQVYKLECPISGHHDICQPILSESQSLDMPGILDIKWARLTSSTALFGLVNAKGEFQVWEISNELKTIKDEKCKQAGEHAALSCVCIKSVQLGQCLGLALDWASSQQESTGKTVASDSSGRLTVFEIGPDVRTLSQWQAHDFEAWTCAFDHWNSNIIYSGSDDNTLKGWDLRSGTKNVFTNKSFTMGVCSIHSNPAKEWLLAVGSYNENLHVYDCRNTQKPLSITPLGGGIWRVKWEPSSSDKLLTATMHNGFHIVDCSLPDCEPLPILAHYTKHTSLAYGVDWCQYQLGTFATQKCKWNDSPSRCAQFLIASCSFYDHSLHLWQWSHL